LVLWVSSAKIGMDSGLISHVFQEGDWDCGLACVRMVLRAVFPGVETRATSSRALTKIVQTRNIWTSKFFVYFLPSSLIVFQLIWLIY